MGKLLEVKEFDSITSNENYIDDKKYKYLEEHAFNNLINFVEQFATDDDDANGLKFMTVTLKPHVGKVVSVKNYVGLIQMKNGTQIQVLPKIDFSEEEDEGNTKTKRIFLRMLRSMKDFPSQVFNDASLKVDRMNLYEIFINMYLQEVRQLVKHGIKSGYVRQEDNLNFFKGKLLVNEHIKINMAHKEKFYVSYDEFLPDRAENKIVKSTLLKLVSLTSSAENSKEIRQLLTSFEMVEPSVNYEKDLARVKIDRSTKDYELLIPWSRVFLMNKSFSTFSGNTNSRALLFPMDKVFESYVAQKMKKVFSPHGWNVRCQDKGYYLFDEPRRQFHLRPDIVITRDNQKIILDTKWKSLIDNEYKNYGISSQDMYQMYAYSKKYDTSEIWLLYPENMAMRNHESIRFTSDGNDGLTNVHVFFVDVEHIEESLSQLMARIEETTNDEL